MFFSLMRRKKELELEVANLTQKLSHQEREQNMVLREQTAAIDLKAREVAALLKLDYQQKLKQFEIDKQRELDVVKAESDKTRAAFEQKLSEDYYRRMKDALNQLHTEGNITTQFLEKMAVSMLGHLPESKVRVTTQALKAE